jgi:hypothetical protein
MIEKALQSPQQEQASLRINGKRAHPQDAKRILAVPATPVNKDDIATKPLETVSRGFNLLR